MRCCGLRRAGGALIGGGGGSSLPTVWLRLSIAVHPHRYSCSGGRKPKRRGRLLIDRSIAFLKRPIPLRYRLIEDFWVAAILAKLIAFWFHRGGRQLTGRFQISTRPVVSCKSNGVFEGRIYPFDPQCLGQCFSRRLKQDGRGCTCSAEAHDAAARCTINS